MVTHDRYFLDSVCNRIVEIDKGKIYSYQTNYSGYLELKTQRQEMETASERKRQSILRVELEWIQRGARARSTKQKARIQRYEELRDRQTPVQDSQVELSSISTRMGKTTVELENICKAYGERKLIDDFSYIFLKGDRVGFIGPNGCGKSTLMKIIAGIIPQDSGQVIIGQTVKMGYYAQEIASEKSEDAQEIDLSYMDPAQRVIDYVKDIAEYITTKDGRISATQLLERFLFTPDMQYAPIGKLSGGEKRRLYLLGVLAENANVLLFDEAGNNLDIPTLTILEDYLNSFTGIVITVSHDRYFLDRVCSDILEVDQRSVCLYKGNYAYYVEKKQERAEAAEARRESDLNLYRRELEWMRRQPQARATKARARIDSFHELDARLKSTRTQASLKLDVQATRIGTKIFEAKELCKRFGDLVILDRFNYNFARYDKLGIVGDNGCGKSTFLKLLTGIIQPDSGTIEVGESVRFGYYSQQGLDFDEGKRVIDIVTDIAHEIHLGDGRRMSASQFLQYFLFPPEVQYSYVARLSGGERKRLYLCTILIQSPNFLILDEPTNDLDIVTLGVLEEYLQAFKGCVIVVSHDRYFVDKVADHLLVFCGGGEIREFAGTYSDYTAWKRDYEAAKQAAVAQEKAKSTASGSRGGEIRKSGTAPAKTGAARKLTFQEKREMEHLEAEIPELEQEKAAIEEKLSSGDLPFEELTALSERITALMDQIDTKSMRWLELSEIGG